MHQQMIARWVDQNTQKSNPIVVLHRRLMYKMEIIIMMCLFLTFRIDYYSLFKMRYAQRQMKWKLWFSCFDLNCKSHISHLLVDNETFGQGATMKWLASQAFHNLKNQQEHVDGTITIILMPTLSKPGAASGRHFEWDRLLKFSKYWAFFCSYARKLVWNTIFHIFSVGDETSVGKVKSIPWGQST